MDVPSFQNGKLHASPAHLLATSCRVSSLYTWIEYLRHGISNRSRSLDRGSGLYSVSWRETRSGQHDACLRYKRNTTPDA
jgi:hypothetical protein